MGNNLLAGLIVIVIALAILIYAIIQYRGHPWPLSLSLVFAIALIANGLYIITCGCPQGKSIMPILGSGGDDNDGLEYSKNRSKNINTYLIYPKIIESVIRERQYIKEEVPHH